MQPTSEAAQQGTAGTASAASAASPPEVAPPPAEESGAIHPPSAAGERLRAHAAFAIVMVLAALLFAARRDRPLVLCGDAYSDGAMLNSGRNFDRIGFVELKLLPVHRPGPPRDLSDYYLHFPPTPDLIVGAQMRLGIRDLADLRALPAALTLAGLVLCYAGFLRILRPSTAVLAATVHALSYPTFWLGDSIHNYPYGDFTRSAILECALAIAAGSCGRLRIAWTALVLLGQSMVSFEYVIYSQVLLFALGATGIDRARRPRTALFLAAPVAGFGIHVVQNMWLLGFSEAIRDWVDALLYRTVSSSERQASLFTPERWLNAVFGRVQRFYGYGASTIAILSVAGAIHAWRDEVDRRALRPLVVLLLAPFTWYILFAQHTIAHTYTVRLYAPAIALGVGLGLRAAFVALREHPALVRAGVLAAVFGTLAAEATFPHFAERFKPPFSPAAEQFLTRVAPLLRADDVVLTGPNPLPCFVVEALLDRPVEVVASPSDVARIAARDAAGGARRIVFARVDGALIAPDLDRFVHARGTSLAADAAGELLAIEVEPPAVAPPGSPVPPAAPPSGDGGPR